MSENAAAPLRVLIIGGGPAGSSCAISLMRQAARLGRQVRVILFEHKHFGTHYNQCMGVLSPPIAEIMDRCLGLHLPGNLIQRRIVGYHLHTDTSSIYLTDTAADDPEPSLATRRVLFDSFFNIEVRLAGVEICQSRVTDIEFSGDGVNLYSEGGSFTGDIVVGAFGLDHQMVDAMQRRTGYRAPEYIDTVVTKIHPDQKYVDAFGDDIHAFLPSRRDIMFGALVPKGNHIAALVSGRQVTAGTLQEFLRSEAVSSVISFPYEVRDMYKGNFPTSPARNFYGDRYIMIGDSAGLVRPFKGKGINSAILTGHYAARLILERGVTRRALSGIENDCAELIGDLWYGRAIRLITGVLSSLTAFDPVLDVARRRPALRQALFDSVSGHDTFHNIWTRLLASPSLFLELAAAIVFGKLRSLLRRLF
jgi:flavin-dependent dehydrogenase